MQSELCNGDKQSPPKIGCIDTSTSLTQARDACHGKYECLLEASNTGIPECLNKIKELHVNYMCGRLN